jgi:hypothetical protein
MAGQTGGYDKHSAEWVVGACINVAGNVLINLGTNIVKLGHNRDQLAVRLGTSTHGRGCLLRGCGWALFTLGSVMNFVSFSFAAQSLLAALGAVQFVVNVAFARYCLDELVSKWTVMATAGIIFGIGMVIFSASHRNTVYSVQELLDLYLAVPYLVYLFFSLAVGAVAHQSYKKMLQRVGTRMPQIRKEYGDLESGGSGQADGNDDSDVNLASIPALERGLLAFFFSVASAVVGTQSVLMAKCTSQVLRLGLQGDNEQSLSSPFTYFILTVFGCSAVFWMKRLNKGLQLFPSVYIVPMMQAMWTVRSILNGGIYFQEFSEFTWWRFLVFFGGVVVVLLSVLSLAGTGAGASGGGEGTAGTELDVDERARLLGDGGGTAADNRVGAGSQQRGGSCIYWLPCVPYALGASERGEMEQSRYSLALRLEMEEQSREPSQVDFCRREQTEVNGVDRAGSGGSNGVSGGGTDTVSGMQPTRSGAWAWANWAWRVPGDSPTKPRKPSTSEEMLP